MQSKEKAMCKLEQTQPVQWIFFTEQHFPPISEATEREALMQLCVTLKETQRRTSNEGKNILTVRQEGG